MPAVPVPTLEDRLEEALLRSADVIRKVDAVLLEVLGPEALAKLLSSSEEDIKNKEATI